mmetsp:Transcript_31783/g.72538  ORF Transcript_31783/g.72538 Transcript_31783/m.72538 type:complete len:231 (+) Transcript_31783:2511-3203(+)
MRTELNLQHWLAVMVLLADLVVGCCPSKEVPAGAKEYVRDGAEPLFERHILVHPTPKLSCTVEMATSFGIRTHKCHSNLFQQVLQFLLGFVISEGHFVTCQCQDLGVNEELSHSLFGKLAFQMFLQASGILKVTLLERRRSEQHVKHSSPRCSQFSPGRLRADFRLALHFIPTQDDLEQVRAWSRMYWCVLLERCPRVVSAGELHAEDVQRHGLFRQLWLYVLCQIAGIL